VSVVADVTAALRAEGIAHALIGATALAVHGVSRATADVDFLTVDRRALDKGLWSGLEQRGASLRVLRGDFDDPLAGSVRVSLPGEPSVDVIVGRQAWEREIVEAAETCSIGDVSVGVASPADLVLLKLHAGGPKDAWDIRSLLESHSQAESIRIEVDRRVLRLPPESRRLWDGLRGE